MVGKMVMSLLTVATAGTLYAAEMSVSERIIGIEGASSTVQADTSGIFGEINHEGKDTEYGVRIGAQSENWRTLLVLNYFDSEDDAQNYEKGLIELDYYPFNTKSETVSIRPYLGLNLGFLNYESDADGTADDIDESGFMYGGQVGITVDLGESIDLDVMFRYSLVEADKVDHVEGLVIGINYLY